MTGVRALWLSSLICCGQAVERNAHGQFFTFAPQAAPKTPGPSLSPLQPSASPTAPTSVPTGSPAVAVPSTTPSAAPTQSPSASPDVPTQSPSTAPSQDVGPVPPPTGVPSAAPSAAPRNETDAAPAEDSYTLTTLVSGCNYSELTNPGAAVSGVGCREDNTVPPHGVCNFTLSGSVCDRPRCDHAGSGRFDFTDPICLPRGHPVSATVDFVVEVPLDQVLANKTQLAAAVAAILGLDPSGVPASGVQATISRPSVSAVVRLPVSDADGSLGLTPRQLAEHARARLMADMSSLNGTLQAAGFLAAPDTVHAIALPVGATPAPTQSTAAPTSESDSSASPVLVAAIVCAAVLCCGSLVLWYMLRKKRERGLAKIKKDSEREAYRRQREREERRASAAVSLVEQSGSSQNSSPAGSPFGTPRGRHPSRQPITSPESSFGFQQQPSPVGRPLTLSRGLQSRGGMRGSPARRGSTEFSAQPSVHWDQKFSSESLSQDEELVTSHRSLHTQGLQTPLRSYTQQSSDSTVDRPRGLVLTQSSVGVGRGRSRLNYDNEETDMHRPSIGARSYRSQQPGNSPMVARPGVGFGSLRRPSGVSSPFRGSSVRLSGTFRAAGQPVTVEEGSC